MSDSEMNDFIGVDIANEQELDFDRHDERFKIDSMDLASWASRKLRFYVRRQRELERYRKAEKARIDALVNRELRDIEDDVEFFEWHLRQYLNDLRAAGHRTKSLHLPGGTVQLRNTKGSLVVDNAEEVLGWLRSSHPNLIRVSEDVDKAGLKTRVHSEDGMVVDSETGEVVPGVRIEGAGERVSFSPSEE